MGFVPSLLGIGKGNGASTVAQGGLNSGTALTEQGRSDSTEDQSQALANQVNSVNGTANLNNTFGQLQGVANGTGPNPAQAMLNQQTGNNNQAQAALMAGQRGAGANVGLMARQAAEQGSANQQNAIGQGATMQANQSLGALGQMSGVAQNQVGNQLNAVNSLNQNQQGVMAGVNQNLASQNGTNGSIAQVNAGTQGKMLQGVTGAAGSAMGLAHGGSVPPGHSDVAAYFKGGHLDGTRGVHKVPGKASVAGDSKKNDTVAAVLSPGEIVIPRSHADDPDKAAAFAHAVVMRNQKKGKK